MPVVEANAIEMMLRAFEAKMTAEAICIVCLVTKDPLSYQNAFLRAPNPSHSFFNLAGGLQSYQ